jgi:membrane-associated phospholipid phosphatase
LISTYDGIVGYWDGMPLRNPKRIGANDADVSYLSTDVRSKLMNSLLFPAFTVNGHDGEATLSVNGAPLLTLRRPEREVFRQQLAMVRAYSDLRTDRINEILVQTGDLFSFYGALGYLSSDRHKNTLSTLYTCQRIAVHVEMPIKHFCRSPRPVDYATHIQPMIQTPDHSAYPSGHATEVFAASTVFSRLMTGLGPKQALSAPVDSEKGRMAGMAFRLAHRIASNRTVAGVHFPVDNASGALIGCLLGDALYRVATGADDWPDPTDIAFDADDPSDPPFDLTLRWLRDQLPDDAEEATPDDSTVFGKLWKDAAEEWEEETP